MTTADTASILVAIPQPMCRDALSETLTATGLHVSGVGTVAEAQVALTSIRYAVALVDAKLPPNGLGLLRSIAETSADVATCLLVDLGDDTDDLLLAAINAGVHGVLSKTTPPGELVDNVLLLAAGGEAYDRFTAGRMVEVLRPGENRTRYARLSRREHEVLDMIAQGHTTSEIGEKLYISQNTVKGIVTDMFGRLEVNNRAAAVATGFRLGLLH